MRSCPHCHSTYPDDTFVCARDGAVLEPTNEADRPLERTASISPPGAPPAAPSGTVDLTGGDLGEDGASSSGEASSGGASSRGGSSGGSPNDRERATQASRRKASSAAASPPEPPKAPPASEAGRGASQNPEDRLGSVVGSYRLVDVIGRGGMGAVYRAEHIRLPGREVALKLLRSDYAQKEDSVGRFIREAQSVDRIQHRNIVSVHDIVEIEGGPTFIVMELLKGESLGRLLRKSGELSTLRSLDILIQTCEGLAAAHEQQIIHRDLKPDNIFISRTEDDRDRVKLLDFGVAKLLSTQEGDVGVHTVAGAVIGTPAFMSPEQAGGMTISARSDIYSLGAIMYEIFTGSTLFKGKSFGEFVRKHLNDTPVPPRQTPGGGDTDPRIEAIILKCLEKNPSRRYAGAVELRDALREVYLDLAGQEQEATPGGESAPDAAGERAGGAHPNAPGASGPAFPDPGPQNPVAAAPAADLAPAEPSASDPAAAGSPEPAPHPATPPPSTPAGTPPISGPGPHTGERLPTPPPPTPSPLPGPHPSGPHEAESGHSASAPSGAFYAQPQQPESQPLHTPQPPDAVPQPPVSGEHQAVSGQHYAVSGPHHAVSGQHYAVSGPHHAVSPLQNPGARRISWRKTIALMLGGGAVLGAVAGLVVFGAIGGGAEGDEASIEGEEPHVTPPSPALDRDGDPITIRIASDPEDAEVVVFRTDEAICRTPCEFQPGEQGPSERHYLVDKEGYMSERVTADLDDLAQQYSVQLEPANR